MCRCQIRTQDGEIVKAAAPKGGELSAGPWGDGHRKKIGSKVSFLSQKPRGERFPAKG